MDNGNYTQIIEQYEKTDNLFDFLSAVSPVLGAQISLYDASGNSLSTEEISSAKFVKKYEIAAKGAQIGYFYISADHEIDKESINLIGLFLQKYMTFFSTDLQKDNIKVAAVRAILEGKSPELGQLQFDSEAGWNAAGTKFCLITIHADREIEKISSLQQRIKHLFRNDVVFNYGGDIIIFLASADSPMPNADVYEKLCSMAKENDFWGCISDEYEDINHTAILHERNLTTLSIVKPTLPRAIENIVYFDDYKSDNMFFLANHACSQLPDTQFVSNTIMKIYKYDLDNDTNLLISLYCYLSSNCNFRVMSQKMFVHKNTAIYKITKIKELFGVDLDSNEEKATLLRSCEMLRLLGKV